MHFKAFFIFLSVTFLMKSNAQTLDFYLEKSLTNSPLLKDYQNQINGAVVDSLMVIAAQRPQINSNTNMLYAPTFKGSNHGYDDAITNVGNYSTTVGIQQYILNRKSLSSKYENIRLQIQSAGNTQKLTSNDIKRVVTNQYLTVFADFSDLTFNQEFLKLMHDEKGMMKSMVEHGVYKQTDYLSLLIESQGQEILVNQLTAQLTKDIHLINQLCGINDTGRPQFQLPDISSKEKSDISQSPLFIQYKLDSLKIINLKSTVDIRYQPKLSWTADAGFLSSALSNLYQHYGVSAGFNLSIPIYDGHQRKLDYQKLTISENTRANYQSFFNIQYNQQIAQYHNDIATNKIVIAQLNSQLKSSEELILMAKVQLNNGNMPIIEFINASKNYITINRSLTQAKLKELQLINELNYLMQ